MEIGSIFVLIAILLLVAFFVSRPFWEGRGLKAVSADEQEISSLMAERERLVTVLQELDFDHAMHKIPAEDYPIMRAELLQKAADVLRKLDSSEAALTDAEDRAPTHDAGTWVEAAIAARRAEFAQRPALTPEADDAIETLIAARKAARREKSGGFCSKCGKPVMRSDVFCSHCGKPLS